MEDPISEEEVIARVLGGDSDAFTLLYDRYKKYIARILCRYLATQDVEDVLLDVFATAFRKLDSFAAKSPFRFWLASIAVRRALDKLRAKPHREVVAPQLDQSHYEWMDKIRAGESISQFDEEEERRNAREVLSWALARLKPEQRVVITLINFEEKSHEEVAKLLGWTVMNVRMRAHRARKALHRILIERNNG